MRQLLPEGVWFELATLKRRHRFLCQHITPTKVVHTCLFRGSRSGGSARGVVVSQVMIFVTFHFSFERDGD